jgi:hypothetical protein
MSRLRRLIQDNEKLARFLGYNPRPIKPSDPKGTLKPIRCEMEQQIRKADIKRITGS